MPPPLYGQLTYSKRRAAGPQLRGGGGATQCGFICGQWPQRAPASWSDSLGSISGREFASSLQALETETERWRLALCAGAWGRDWPLLKNGGRVDKYLPPIGRQPDTESGHARERPDFGHGSCR